MKINKHDAPDGYIAVDSRGYTCLGCAFDYLGRCNNKDREKYPCSLLFRKDENDVVFHYNPSKQPLESLTLNQTK